MLKPKLPAQKIRWHNDEIVFHRCGEGEAVVLIHGIAGSFDTWNGVLPLLGERVQALAPDLIGHGRSTKPRGDYSLGAFATGVRDLMEALEIPSATIVGHSLGGGIAMQFAYQFPKRVRRLVLVDSGGLGPEVTSILRAATLPGSELVISMLASQRSENAGQALIRRLRRLGLHVPSSAASVAEHLAGLRDKEARKAFVATARSVIDLRGQRVDARDRLHLASEVPTMFVWGARDRFIPVTHAYEAHATVANSRLEVFERSGHFPHEDDPGRFTEVLLDFIATTEPAEISVELLREHALRDARPEPWEPPAPVDEAPAP